MRRPASHIFFFFNDTATTEIYTLSLHDALPISLLEQPAEHRPATLPAEVPSVPFDSNVPPEKLDRKSTRLNSSHLVISYAVFCLKKKNTIVIALLTLQHHTIQHQQRRREMRTPH